MHHEKRGTMTAWLAIAAGDDRQHGGNDGYDADHSSYYSWTSRCRMPETKYACPKCDGKARNPIDQNPSLAVSEPQLRL
jgi:hypothetical protein